jgi:hypothetical protein
MSIRPRDEWFVDPERGHDGNDGRHAHTALKTFAELSRRLVIVDTNERNINVLADVPIEDPIPREIQVAGNYFVGRPRSPSS